MLQTKNYMLKFYFFSQVQQNTTSASATGQKISYRRIDLTVWQNSCSRIRINILQVVLLTWMELSCHVKALAVSSYYCN